MAKTTIMMLLMTVLFLSGVLFGVDQASQGITEIRGYATPSVERAIQTNGNQDGAYEVEVMGQNFEQVDIEEKEENFQEVKSTHMTQKVAGTMENGVKFFYNQVIESAHQLVQAFF